MHISILGAGYVGLVTAACLAKMGNTVAVIDRDEARIGALRRGLLPFHEPGLGELTAHEVAAGRLSFHSSVDAARGTILTIVAVGTLDSHDEWTDAAVRDAVAELATTPGAPRLVAVRSTLMPGTARSLAAAAHSHDSAVELAVNPEFTREGSAVADFMAPDRVVIGVGDSAAAGRLAELLVELYAPLGAPTIVTDLTSAETIKVASNVFLAAKVAFANELARVCAATGADVHAVVDGLGMDRRIGRAFLSPGPGYGGSCFPSQARALPAFATRLGVATQMMAAIDPSNEAHAAWHADRLEAALGGSLRGARLAILGLTFKAGTSDLRESPAVRLARLFGRRGASLALYDPTGAAEAARLLAAASIAAAACASPEAACRDADAVIVATEWPEFAALDWHALAAEMRGRLVVDTRKVIDVGAAADAGLRTVPEVVRRPTRAPATSVAGS